MNWKKIVLTLILITIILFIYNYIQISQVYIKKIKLPTNKLSKPLKITQISDFHSNERINLDSLFQKIEAFEPDLILITGDLIDAKTIDLTLAFKVLEKSKAIQSKVYFVNGNHEVHHSRGYFENGNHKTNHLLSDEFNNGLEKYKVKVLDNATDLIEINGEMVNIFGASFFAGEEDFIKLFTNIEQDNYNILLSHSPNRPIMYLNKFTDLILSGHTHGGQVRLPFIGAIIAPGQGLFPKYDKGLFKFGNTNLYIDSGLGNSLFPIRLFNRVQITNIIIEPK